MGTLRLLILTFLPLSVSTAYADLEKNARAILQEKCASCHSPTGKAANVFGDIMDLENLLKRKQVKPGHPDESNLIEQIEMGLMPQTGNITPEELKTLKSWIKAQEPIDDTFVSCSNDAAMRDRIKADMDKFPSGDRRFMRYISLDQSHKTKAQLEVEKQALKKALNSLSWEKNLVEPEDVDGKGLLRIDIRKLGWKETLWNRIQRENPFRDNDDTSKRLFSQLTRGSTEFPVMRADWFVSVGTRPPLYHDILELPNSVPALERLLGVNAQANIDRGAVQRAGFRNSGVSKNNRIIERHESKFGYYWKSYDFASNGGRKNIFANPINFDADGGEMIFTLPNGMQAYFLANEKGIRIDKGPIQVVNDPARPDQAVENGVSCMRCHSGGLIDKKDAVAAAVKLTPALYSADDIRKVGKLYASDQIILESLKKDSARHQEAMRKMNLDPAKDPITAVVQKFETDLSLDSAACELGVELRELVTIVLKSFKEIGGMASLITTCNITRDEFLETFESAREIKAARAKGIGLEAPSNEQIEKLRQLKSLGASIQEIAKRMRELLPKATTAADFLEIASPGIANPSDAYIAEIKSILNDPETLKKFNSLRPTPKQVNAHKGANGSIPASINVTVAAMANVRSMNEFFELAEPGVRNPNDNYVKALGDAFRENSKFLAVIPLSINEINLYKKHPESSIESIAVVLQGTLKRASTAKEFLELLDPVVGTPSQAYLDRLKALGLANLSTFINLQPNPAEVTALTRKYNTVEEKVRIAGAALPNANSLDEFLKLLVADVSNPSDFYQAELGKAFRANLKKFESFAPSNEDLGRIARRNDLGQPLRQAVSEILNRRLR